MAIFLSRILVADLLACLGAVVGLMHLFRRMPLRGTSASCAATVSQLLLLDRRRYESPLRNQWYDRRCMNWFRGNGTLSPEQGRRPSWHEVPLRTTREDLCFGGRHKCCRGARTVQEVIVVDVARMIYVPVRKVGSTHMKTAFEKAFQASQFEWCKRGGKVRCGRRPRNSCTSECLELKHQQYYVFGFVRNPLTRVYASLTQVASNRPIGSATALAWLTRLMNGTCGVNWHLESQSKSLSTPLPSWVSRDGPRELPFDFIGRLEHLEEDMERVKLNVLRRLNTSEQAVAAPKFQHLMGLIGGPKVLPRFQENRKHIQSLKSKRIDKLTKAVYSQDCVCFGCKEE